MTATAPDPIRLLCVQLSFRFQWETFDPDEITRRIGIDPTMTFLPGDPITAEGAGRRRRPGWRLAVEARETLELDDLLADLRDLVPVSGRVVRQICADLGVTAVVICSVFQRRYEITPALNFPADFLGWLSGLGASLDVDIWI